MEQGAPSDPTLRREGPPSEPTTENVLMPEPQPAERLGRFLVIEAIGQGGMGVVYRGYDPALDRRVALKVLRAQVSGAGATARLAREAQAMARLAHPNVVPVYDVGRAGESLFVAMEFVQGETLQAWLGKKRAWREVLGVCVQAGRGLEAAHAAGIIHRDFKPANVLVGGDGRARVTDFGLARANGDAERPSTPIMKGAISLETPLTLAGSVMGTPGYMAPEQYLGQESTAAADQYAFCATLYEALYGRRPFVGPDLQTMARLTQAGEVPLPPRGASVPGWLFPIIVKGLSPNPAQRHASMGVLLELLQKDPSQRRRRWAVVTIAAVLTVAVGVGAWLWPLVRASGCHRETDRIGTAWTSEARQRTETAFRATQLPFAGTALEFVRTTLDSVSRRWVAERHRACDDSLLRQRRSERDLDLRLACLENRRVELTTLVKQFEQADATLVTSAVAAVSQLGSVERCANVELLESRALMTDEVRRGADAIEQQLSEGRMLVALGRFDQAAGVLSSADTAARALNDTQTLGLALLEVGTLALQERRYPEARRSLDEALRLALAAGDDRTALRALGLSTSLVGWRLAQPLEALALVNVGRGLVARVNDPLLEALLDEGEGDARWRIDGSAGSLEAYQRALEHFEAGEGSTGLDVARVKSSIAWLLSEQGQPEKAQVACEEARQLQEALLGSEHPALRATWSTLSRIADELDDREAAVLATRRAHAASLRVSGAQSPATVQQAITLAGALAKVGLFDEAERLLENAAQLPSPPLDLHLHLAQTRAFVLLMKRDLEAASKAAHVAVDLAIKARVQRAHVEILLGVIEGERGEDVAARALLERSLQAYVELGYQHGHDSVEGYLMLAKVLARQHAVGHEAAAEDAFARALRLDRNLRLKAEAAMLVAKVRWAKHAPIEARAAASQALSFAVEKDQAALRAEAERFLAEHPAE